MSEKIDHERRRFLGIAAGVVGANQFGLLEGAAADLRPDGRGGA